MIVRPLLAACLLLVTAACASEPRARAAVGAPRAHAAAHRGLHVSGNRLRDGSGHVVRFHGVNRSGTEYACVQGWGIFDGPRSAASVRAIARWGVNVVRVPINEQCWLGINGVKRSLSGSRYQRAIASYVRLLHRQGMYAELSLMWAAPGANRATYQSGGPDADHSPAVWRGMARAFRNDPNVILAPWGETVVDARCFLRGGVCEATFGPSNRPYRVAGMQQAVNVMRAAGYRGVISIPGINYANDLSHWLRQRPRDPLHNLVAEAHVYGKNQCDTPACFNRTIAPVARRVPVILGETGETYDGSSCGHANTQAILDWADSHGVGYMAWTWDTWGNCEALISSYSGRPRADFGRYVHDRFLRTRAQARRLAR